MLMTSTLELEDDCASLEAALAFLESCESDATDDARSDLSGDSDTALSNEAAAPSCGLHSLSPSAHTMDSSTVRSSNSHPSDTAPPPTATAEPVSGMHHHSTAPHARATPTVRAPRRRKSNKVEIAALRGQVQHLTVLLAQLELLRRKRASSRKLMLRRHATQCTARTTPTAAAVSSLLTDQTTSSAAFDAAVRELQQLQTAQMLNLELRAKWREQIELAKRLEALVKKPMETIVRTWCLCM